MIVDKKWSFNYEYDYYFYSDNKDYLGMVKIRNKKAIFICNDSEEGRIYSIKEIRRTINGLSF